MNHATSHLRSTFKPAVALILFCVAVTLASSAQTFTSLANFDGTNGYAPVAALVQGVDGNFYGATNSGGIADSGAVFKISPLGDLSLLQSFCGAKGCPLGTNPQTSLTLSYSGTLFGVAGGGGANFTGTVFRSTPSGAYHPIYKFCSLPACADGENPYGGVIQATDGFLYGTTYNGGANTFGSIFKINPAGQLTTVYSFCATSGCTDGAAPPAPVMQAANGNFYGTTVAGGANGKGTIFELTPAGVLTTLYNFCSQTNCADGMLASKLVQGSKGDFYGTTQVYGAFKGGTVFKLTTTGTFITLHSFCQLASCPDGQTPGSELIQANDGNLYGTTEMGGTNNSGTIFKITVDGAFTTLHSFDGTDGEVVVGGLVQGTDGKLYGTTAAGGSLAVTCNNIVPGCGTIFSLDLGLPPLVRTLVPFANIGNSVVIYGTNLSAATSVKFNGVSASFTIVSSTEIKATVPAGATPGKIQVVTPAGTISSTTIFRVRS